MKCRKGFVSNSSTTSFMIYGICADDVSEFKSVDDEYIEDTIRRIFDGEFVMYQPGDSIYIGKSWDDVGNNETGAEFKQNIEALFEKVMGHKVECDTYSESYMD